jgi:hypothetical protein
VKRFSDRAHDLPKPKIGSLRRPLIATGRDNPVTVLAPPRRSFRDALTRHEVSWPGRSASAAPPPTP